MHIQVKDKLNDMYDMKRIEENEYTPDDFVEMSVFILPDDEFGDLLQKKAVYNKHMFIVPQSTGTRLRKKRRDSGRFLLALYQKFYNVWEN